MVANLLHYTGRIAKWCIVLRAFDTMCTPRTPIKGQILANLVVGPVGRPLEEGAATQSDSRGLCGETSSGRYILISSDLLKRLNGALAMKGPRTSYFRGIITHRQLSKCQTEPRSCMVLGYKPMGKLIILYKYLSDKQNQGLAWSTGPRSHSLMGPVRKLRPCKKKTILYNYISLVFI